MTHELPPVTASNSPWRPLALMGALLLTVVALVAFAVGVASGGSSTAQAAQASTIPGHPELGPGWYAPGSFRGGTAQVAITITKIDGGKLSLQTTDGWTRTIDATGAAITKGGQTVAVASLKIGDQINFRESRQSDGTYKITTIEVLVPSASGTVTAIAAGSVTITQFDGSTRTLTLSGSTTYSEGGAAVSKSALVVGVRISAQGTVDGAGNFTATAITIAPSSVQGTVASKTATTIVVTTAAGKTVTLDVSSATKYSVRGVSAPTLADVGVGDRIAVQGTLNADGSLAATMVQASPNDQPGFGGPGFGGRGFGGGLGRGRGFGGPNGSATPQPSAVPSASSV
jgi:hypothetical protein